MQTVQTHHRVSPRCSYCGAHEEGHLCGATPPGDPPLHAESLKETVCRRCVCACDCCLDRVSGRLVPVADVAQLRAVAVAAWHVVRESWTREGVVELVALRDALLRLDYEDIVNGGHHEPATGRI